MTPHTTQEKFKLSLLKNKSIRLFVSFAIVGSLVDNLKAESRHLGDTHNMKVPIEWTMPIGEEVAHNSSLLIAEYLSLNDLGGQGTSIFPPVRERYQTYLA